MFTRIKKSTQEKLNTVMNKINFIFALVLLISACNNEPQKLIEQQEDSAEFKHQTIDERHLYKNIQTGELMFVETNYPISMWDTVIMCNFNTNINTADAKYEVWGLYINEELMPKDYIDSISYAFYDAWQRIK